METESQVHQCPMIESKDAWIGAKQADACMSAIDLSVALLYMLLAWMCAGLSESKYVLIIILCTIIYIYISIYIDIDIDMCHWNQVAWQGSWLQVVRVTNI